MDGEREEGNRKNDKGDTGRKGLRSIFAGGPGILRLMEN
jgi:hypothetical protein